MGDFLINNNLQLNSVSILILCKYRPYFSNPSSSLNFLSSYSWSDLTFNKISVDNTFSYFHF